jgi:hypothetical protein
MKEKVRFLGLDVHAETIASGAAQEGLLFYSLFPIPYSLLRPTASIRAASNPD